MPSIISSLSSGFSVSRHGLYVLLLICCGGVGLAQGPPPPAPDLIVSQLSTFPANPEDGDTVQFFVEMRNDGDAWTPPGVAVTATVRLNGQSLGMITASIGAGQIQPIPPSLTYFSELGSTWTAVEGVHQVCAIVDEGGLIHEWRDEDGDGISEAEENNSTCISLTVAPPPRPDLVIEHLSTTPNPPQAGDAVAIWPRIRNVGPVRTAIGTPVEVQVTVNGSVVGTFTAVSGGQPITLGPQQAYVGRPPQDWFPGSGIYQVCASADPSATIVESNEGNNILCVSITVSGPDLEIPHISWSPQAPRAGDTVVVEATVRNNGLDATPEGIDIVSVGHVGGTSLGTFRVEDSGGQPFALGASQQHNGTLSGQWTAVEGTHLICVEADSTNTIAEGSETNNMRCGQVNVSSACQITLGPESFGTVDGPMTDPDETVAYYALNESGCSDVVLTLEPGHYTYQSPQHIGVNLGRGIDTDPPTQANVTVQFEAGDYVFNRELFFSAFSADKDLRIRGAGQDQTRLRFCSDPNQCACVVQSEKAGSSSVTGSCESDLGWSMMHFRGGARRVVIEDLSLEGVKLQVPGSSYTWEFGVGIALCYDGSQCGDITIRRVSVEGARVAVLSRNANNVAILDSRLAEHEVGYQATGTIHDGVLLSNNLIENQDKAKGTKYGIFTATGLTNSAIVGNTITNVAARGIYPPTGTDGLWIHGNTVTNSGTSGSGAGINLGQPGINDVLVSSNVIQGVGDGALPFGLGSMPIQDCDEAEVDELEVDNKPPRFQSRWPNSPWNGYGISVSGAMGGVIGLVGNRIFGVSSHGIKVMPGSSGVMILDNEVAGSGVNGLSIVPGYAYRGEFGYTPKGPIRDIWVQGNTFDNNARAGIEILPRGTPRFAVPSTCVTADGCLHAHQAYGLCNSLLPNPNPLCVDDYDPNLDVAVSCVSSSESCTSNCFDPSWQSYRVDMHDNVTQLNTLANVVINATRVEADPQAVSEGRGVHAHFTLSGAVADLDGGEDNFYLPENSPFGVDTLSSSCVRSDGAPGRDTNGAVAEYASLLQRIKGLTFTVYDGAWTQRHLWTELGISSGDFDVAAPSTCDTGTTGSSSSGGSGSSGGGRPGSGVGGPTDLSVP